MYVLYYKCKWLCFELNWTFWSLVAGYAPKSWQKGNQKRCSGRSVFFECLLKFKFWDQAAKNKFMCETSQIACRGTYCKSHIQAVLFKLVHLFCQEVEEQRRRLEACPSKLPNERCTTQSSVSTGIMKWVQVWFHFLVKSYVGARRTIIGT